MQWTSQVYLCSSFQALVRRCQSQLMKFCPLRKDLSAACGHSSNVEKPPSLGKTGNAISNSSSLLQRCSSIFFSQVVFTMKHEFGAGLHLCLSKEPVCCNSALWMSQSSVQSLVRVPKSSEDRPVSSSHGPPAFPFRTSSNQRRRYQMWIPTRTNVADDARRSPRLAASRFVCRVSQVALHP